MQLKIDQRVFLSPTKRKVEVNIVQSNYHIEITPRYGYTKSLHIILALKIRRSHLKSAKQAIMTE
jgi:hypothetical protein